jgi:hypothetical protein
LKTINSFIILAYLALLPTLLRANDSIKSIAAVRVSTPPQIDGKLNDDVWRNAPVAKDFVQFVPNNGAPAWQRTEVRFLYDNTAFYIGAMLYDSAPDSILTGMSERDNINNADYMGIYLDPQGTGTNGYGFFVTASGIQLDMKVDQHNEDDSWDAVWKSETSITDSGWIVEIKIPFTAIRFPKAEIQNWKINVWRNIMRHRQNTNWNFVNREKDGILTQCGQLTGVNSIKPPLRLSFMPYVSGYYENNPESKGWNSLLNGGMDVKYGINESFTVDMTLIPDFGQVQSDDKISNLSPFEIYYNEKRSFFTEGTELFNKLGMFYSRRIGGKPVNHDLVGNNLKNGEEIVSNPKETKMINATKLSGRTKSGLGIGFFNAMTDASYATIKDSLGNERKFQTQPFTNYNMIVLDQDLKNNSSFNISNTNLLHSKDGYIASVTESELLLKDKSKQYVIDAKGGLSSKNNGKTATYWGQTGYFKTGKIAGKFQGFLSYLFYTDKFEMNDMGYLNKNNFTEYELFLRYQISKPFWIINNWYSHIDMYRWGLYKNNVFTANGIFINSNITFKNQYQMGINSSLFPNGDKDYYEPRVNGRFVVPFNKQFHIGGWINTDSRKKISVYFNPGRRWWDDAGHYEYWFNQSANYRITDKLSMYYELNTSFTKRQKGWVETNNKNNDTIYFGKRNIEEITNSLSGKYIFGKSAYISLRARYYMQNVEFENQYYELNIDGTLRNSTYTGNHNSNYNAFNIDLLYAWRFAPGSELSIVWKNIIETNDDFVVKNYRKNFDNIIESPQANSISIKINYYFDYLYLKRK